MNIGTPIEGQTSLQPKTKNNRTVLPLFGVGAALMGGVFLALKLSANKDEKSNAEVVDFKGAKEKTGKKEVADEERRKLMAEMGRKGAQMRLTIRCLTQLKRLS